MASGQMFIDSATAHSAAFAELVRYLARDVAAAATASTRKSADLADAFAAVLSGADAAAGAMSARALRYAERIRRVLNNDSFAKFSAFVADHKARLGLMLAPAIATAARSAHDATALASTFAASASVRADDWAGQVRAFASSSGRRVADVIHGCKPLYVRALHVSAAGYDVFVAFAALAKNDVSTRVRSTSGDDVCYWLYCCALFVFIYYIIVFRLLIPNVEFIIPRAIDKQKPGERRKWAEGKRPAISGEEMKKRLRREREERHTLELQQEQQRRREEQLERERQQEEERRRAEQEKWDKEQQARSLERRLRRIWMESRPLWEDSLSDEALSLIQRVIQIAKGELKLEVVPKKPPLRSRQIWNDIWGFAEEAAPQPSKPAVSTPSKTSAAATTKSANNVSCEHNHASQQSKPVMPAAVEESKVATTTAPIADVQKKAAVPGHDAMLTTKRTKLMVPTTAVPQKAATNPPTAPQEPTPARRAQKIHFASAPEAATSLKPSKQSLSAAVRTPAVESTKGPTYAPDMPMKAALAPTESSKTSEQAAMPAVGTTAVARTKSTPDALGTSKKALPAPPKSSNASKRSVSTAADTAALPAAKAQSNTPSTPNDTAPATAAPKQAVAPKPQALPAAETSKLTVPAEISLPTDKMTGSSPANASMKASSNQIEAAGLKNGPIPAAAETKAAATNVLSTPLGIPQAQEVAKAAIVPEAQATETSIPPVPVALKTLAVPSTTTAAKASSSQNLEASPGPQLVAKAPAETSTTVAAKRSPDEPNKTDSRMTEIAATKNPTPPDENLPTVNVPASDAAHKPSASANFRLDTKLSLATPKKAGHDLAKTKTGTDVSRELAKPLPARDVLKTNAATTAMEDVPPAGKPEKLPTIAPIETLAAYSKPDDTHLSSLPRPVESPKPLVRGISAAGAPATSVKAMPADTSSEATETATTEQTVVELPIAETCPVIPLVESIPQMSTDHRAKSTTPVSPTAKELIPTNPPAHSYIRLASEEGVGTPVDTMQTDFIDRTPTAESLQTGEVETAILNSSEITMAEAPAIPAPDIIAGPPSLIEVTQEAPVGVIGQGVVEMPSMETAEVAMTDAPVEPAAQPTASTPPIVRRDVGPATLREPPSVSTTTIHSADIVMAEAPIDEAAGPSSVAPAHIAQAQRIPQTMPSSGNNMAPALPPAPPAPPALFTAAAKPSRTHGDEDAGPPCPPARPTVGGRRLSPTGPPPVGVSTEADDKWMAAAPPPPARPIVAGLKQQTVPPPVGVSTESDDERTSAPPARRTVGGLRLPSKPPAPVGVSTESDDECTWAPPPRRTVGGLRLPTKPPPVLTSPESDDDDDEELVFEPPARRSVGGRRPKLSRARVVDSSASEVEDYGEDDMEEDEDDEEGGWDGEEEDDDDDDEEGGWWREHWEADSDEDDEPEQLWEEKLHDDGFDLEWHTPSAPKSVPPPGRKILVPKSRRAAVTARRLKQAEAILADDVTGGIIDEDLEEIDYGEDAEEGEEENAPAQEGEAGDAGEGLYGDEDDGGYLEGDEDDEEGVFEDIPDLAPLFRRKLLQPKSVLASAAAKRLKRAEAIARASAMLDEQPFSQQSWAAPPPGRKIIQPRSQLALAPTIHQMALASAQQDSEEAAVAAQASDAATKRVKSAKSSNEESLPPATATDQHATSSATAGPAPASETMQETTNADGKPSPPIVDAAQVNTSTTDVPAVPVAAPPTRIWGPLTVTGSDVVFAVPPEQTEAPPRLSPLPAASAPAVAASPDGTSYSVSNAGSFESPPVKYVESAHSQSPPPQLRQKASKAAAVPTNHNNNNNSSLTTAVSAKAAEVKATPRVTTKLSTNAVMEGPTEERVPPTTQLANQKLKFLPKKVQRRPPEERGSMQ